MFSMHTNLVVTVIVVCLAHTGSQQSTKKRTRIRWKENPVYVQNFVSRMMSKHPIIDEYLPRNIKGFSREPNLGYEPYWTDMPDIPWERKCKRCTALFKQYDTVCATDYTGEVLMNITMCKLMEMNCLNGKSYGRTKDKEGDLGYYYVVDEGWVRFAARQTGELHLRLAHTPDKKYPYYWVIIDGASGTTNYMGRNKDLWQRNYNKGGYRVLNNDTFTEFVIYWNSTSGWFLMTLSKLSDYRHGFHFNLTDRNPFPIKYISISGTDYTSDWILHDLPTGFIVNQLKPCAGHLPGMAKFVPTSPTEIPVVMSNLSPANIAYFSRVDFANVNQDQVSFLTREEY